MKRSLQFLIQRFPVAACAVLVGFFPHPQHAFSHMDRTPGAAQDVVKEKRERTPAQQKIDTQLLYALYRERGEAKTKGVPAGELRVKFDDKGRALITVRARVTKALLARIQRLGGKIVSSSVRYNDIRAHLPLGKLEDLAALKDVRAIMPAEEAATNSPN
jgi:hypothetical protein